MKTKILISALCVLTLNSCDQKNADPELENASKVVTNFYNWYLEVISEDAYSEFNPEFVVSQDSMTDLNMTKYLKNLEKNRFSNNLIDRTRNEFQPCIQNLEKTHFNDFQNFDGLDDYEAINCAFSNVYRWLWNMEAPDDVEIIDTKRIDSNQILVTAKPYSVSNEERFFWKNNITVTLESIDDIWKINWIENEIKN